MPEYEVLAKDIFEKIGKEQFTLEGLIKQYNGQLKKEAYISALRFMLDENIVRINSKNELEKG